MQIKFYIIDLTNYKHNERYSNEHNSQKHFVFKYRLHIILNNWNLITHGLKISFLRGHVAHTISLNILPFLT